MTEAPKIKEVKDVWLVETNTDLTEGRGQNYVRHVTETKATALRLAKKGYVQGTDCPVRKGFAIKIDYTWFIPGKLVPPTKEDRRVQEHLDEQEKRETQKQQAIQRARELGLTEEELEALK